MVSTHMILRILAPRSLLRPRLPAALSRAASNAALHSAVLDTLQRLGERPPRPPLTTSSTSSTSASASQLLHDFPPSLPKRHWDHLGRLVRVAEARPGTWYLEEEDLIDGSGELGSSTTPALAAPALAAAAAAAAAAGNEHTHPTRILDHTWDHREGMERVPGDRWVSLRCDGHGFKHVVRRLRDQGVLGAGFSDDFGAIMQRCCRALMEATHAQCGYTQSDELVVLIPPRRGKIGKGQGRGRRQGEGKRKGKGKGRNAKSTKGSSPHMYGGRVTKTCTLASSLVTAHFNHGITRLLHRHHRHRRHRHHRRRHRHDRSETNPEVNRRAAGEPCHDDDRDSDSDSASDSDSGSDEAMFVRHAVLGSFDCRMGSYGTREEAMAVVLWRAYDCGVNGVSDAVYHVPTQVPTANETSHVDDGGWWDGGHGSDSTRGGGDINGDTIDMIEAGEMEEDGEVEEVGATKASNSAESAQSAEFVEFVEFVESMESVEGASQEEVRHIMRLGTLDKLLWLRDRGLLPLPAHQSQGTLFARTHHVKAGFNPKTQQWIPTRRTTIEAVPGHVLSTAAEEGGLWRDPPSLDDWEWDGEGGGEGGGKGGGKGGGEEDPQT